LENVLVERSSDGRRENIGIIHRVSFGITVRYIEESIEVVRVLIDMNHGYGSLGANAHTQASDRRTHRSQRVFSL
jgi:hypothetical protein